MSATSTPPDCLGADGCPGGWYAVHVDANTGALAGDVYATFGDLVTTMPAGATLAVDIPIGLRAAGSRRCDVEARQLLSPRRSTSVFPAPLRAVLDAPTHAAASARRREIEERGMSIQAFAITKKVREVDDVLRSMAARHAHVVEVHPEVSFAALNEGRPLMHAKKTREGRDERRALLSAAFGNEPDRLIATRDRQRVAADDVLDAVVALWSAQRVALGIARALPGIAEHDEHGLPMAIHF